MSAATRVRPGPATPTRPAVSRPSAAVPWRLTLLLTRPGGGRASALVLPVVAFGAVTTLLLTVLAGAWSFRQWDDNLAGLYQGLAAFALVLLVVPLVSLGGAAARLSARRRDDRLATLRLLGATPGTVRQVTVIEAVALALAGALAGVGGYLALGPAVQLIPFRGEPIGAAYWLPPLAVLGVVAVVGLLAAVSASVALRRVIVSPLGVRRRQPAPTPHWVRAAGAAVVVVGAVVALNSSYASQAVGIAVVLGAFAAALAVINLVGPWVIGRLARRRLSGARTADELLAARGIGDAPKAVWRQVSAAAMAAFVAVVAGSAVAMMAESSNAEEAYLVADIRTGVLITLVAIFLMVAASTGVNQAADVLDRADLYGSLAKLGAPLEVMDRARTATVMVPVTRVVLGSALLSAVLVLPLAGAAVVVDPVTVGVVLACLALGVGLVRLAVAATGPLLRSVLRA